jgi:hypothetical protein
MSAVVEAIEGIGDGINKYIIEPIKNDPLTFIATVAAGAYLGPAAAGMFGTSAAAGVGIAAGAANAAAGLVQGEDFDEAIKGGALAGVTTWAGSALAGKFGSTSTLDDSITAGKTGTSSAASTSNAATVGAQSADEIALGASTKPSSFNVSNEAAKSWAGSGRAATDVLDDTLRLDVNAPPSQVPPANTTAQYMRAQPNTASAANTANAANAANAPVDVTGGVYTGVKNAGLNAIDDSAALLDDAARLKGSQMPGGGLKPPTGYDLLDESANVPKNGLTPSPMTKAQFGPQIEMLDDVVAKPTMLDKALGYGKDAYDLAVRNPYYAGAGALGLAYLGQDKDDPPEGGNNEQIGDSSFYDPMRLYNYNRGRVNYAGDITQYGRTGGEHQFFTPTVYEPIQYAAGGSVAPDNYGYYTYGNIPKTMKGFAQGGLSALAKGGNFDGRSDDIPAVLSDGEFVIDAETVALLGNGSSKAGANRLEEMRQAVRKQKGGALSRGQFSPDAKSPLAYLKSSKKSRG